MSKELIGKSFILNETNNDKITLTFDANSVELLHKNFLIQQADNSYSLDNTYVDFIIKEVESFIEYEAQVRAIKLFKDFMELNQNLSEDLLPDLLKNQILKVNESISSKKFKSYKTDYIPSILRDNLRRFLLSLFQEIFQILTIKDFDKYIDFLAKKHYCVKLSEYRKGILNFSISDNLSIPLTIDQLFTENFQNYEDFLEILITCVPPLLDVKDGKYLFVGNINTHASSVGYFFKVLKDNNVVKASINRNIIAQTLTSSIDGFRISGSSTYNKSNLYEDKYEKDFDNKIKILKSKIKPD